VGHRAEIVHEPIQFLFDRRREDAEALNNEWNLALFNLLTKDPRARFHRCPVLKPLINKLR